MATHPLNLSRLATHSARTADAEFRRGDAYDLIPELPAKSIDLVLTSPPYWGLRNYGKQHNWNIHEVWAALGKSRDEPPSYEWYRAHDGVLGLEPYPAWYVHNLTTILDRTKSCLKDSGSLWVNLGDTYFARWASIREMGRQGLGANIRERRRTPMGGVSQEKQLMLIPARFAIRMQELGWILRNDLIWHKPNVPPRPEKDRLRLAHEHFFHFVKRPSSGRAKYYYDQTATEARSNDVVVCTVKPGKNGHSATFPEELIKPRILSSCPPNGTVLDPFCGTGRALSVATESGRDAIGFDLEAGYLT
jgi:site-specific DNA-methyltransferase (cytosine-N4-specific)